MTDMVPPAGVNDLMQSKRGRPREKGEPATILILGD